LSRNQKTINQFYTEVTLFSSAWEQSQFGAPTHPVHSSIDAKSKFGVNGASKTDSGPQPRRHGGALVGLAPPNKTSRPPKLKFETL